MQIVYKGDTKSIRLAYKGQYLPELSEDVAAGPPSPLDHIEITAPPLKTQYKPGEEFDPTGITVWAVLQDGSALMANHSALSFSPSGPLTEDINEITVSLTWGSVTKTATQPISLYAVIGVMWSAAEKVVKRLTPENDPNSFVTKSIVGEPEPAVGERMGSSPFDVIMPWAGMYECNIVDGTVIKKGEEGFSRTEHNTMIYIPEFWVYQTGIDMATGNYYWYISNLEKEGFVEHPGGGRYIGRYTVNDAYKTLSGHQSRTGMSRPDARRVVRQLGVGWFLYDIATLSALQFLFLVEFASFDSQAKIGRGYVDGNTVQIATGVTDSMIYHTGRAEGTDGKTAVQYRGIENPWGNLYQWVDGVNVDSRLLRVCTDPTKYVDDTAANYLNTGISLSATNGWINHISPYRMWIMIPSATIDNEEQAIIPDYLIGRAGSGWGTTYSSGTCSSGSQAGLWFFCGSATSTGSSLHIGVRAIYDPRYATQTISEEEPTLDE